MRLLHRFLCWFPAWALGTLLILTAIAVSAGAVWPKVKAWDEAQWDRSTIIVSGPAFWTDLTVLVVVWAFLTWFTWPGRGTATREPPPADAFGFDDHSVGASPPQQQPSPIDQLEMADRFVVGEMQAVGRLSDGEIMIHAEVHNMWTETVEFARLRGAVYAEAESETYILEPLQMVTEPSAAPGKFLVIGFTVPLHPNILEHLRPSLASPEGLLLDLRRVELCVESPRDRNVRTGLKLWDGLRIRGEDEITSKRGWPVRNL